jgi:hypothetical protein
MATVMNKKKVLRVEVKVKVKRPIKKWKKES